MAVVGEYLAHRAPNAVIRVLVEALQYPHNLPPIEGGRSIAKHVYRPPTNRSVGVGGHFQNPLPDLRNFGLQLARAERAQRSAALARIGTLRQFKPARDITFPSSHWFRSSSGNRGRLASSPLPIRMRSGRIPCLGLGRPTWPRAVNDLVRLPRGSLARILRVWFDRGCLLGKF